MIIKSICRAPVIINPQLVLRTLQLALENPQRHEALLRELIHQAFTESQE